MSPRQRIQIECARRGRVAFGRSCAAVILGDDSDTALILVLGGEHARHILEHAVPDDQAYWFRVWAARGLLWAWDDAGMDAIRTALGDSAWRVREMAAKVVARNQLGDLLPAVVMLRADPIERVRSAARRAVAALTRVGA
jgi:HEAT repeats